MKIRHALIALAATACSGTTPTGKGSGDTASTGSCATLDNDEPTIESVSASCDAPGLNIIYDVRTTGLTGDGFVWGVESYAQPWDEIHNLPAVDFDPCGSYDHLRLQVKATGDFTQYSDDPANPASGFSCDEVQGDGLTYAFAVNDQNGAIADCKVAGHDPDAVIAGGYAGYLGTGPAPIVLANCAQTTLAR